MWAHVAPTYRLRTPLCCPSAGMNPTLKHIIIYHHHESQPYHLQMLSGTSKDYNLEDLRGMERRGSRWEGGGGKGRCFGYQVKEEAGSQVFSTTLRSIATNLDFFQSAFLSAGDDSRAFISRRCSIHYLSFSPLILSDTCEPLKSAERPLGPRRQCGMHTCFCAARFDISAKNNAFYAR